MGVDGWVFIPGQTIECVYQEEHVNERFILTIILLMVASFIVATPVLLCLLQIAVVVVSRQEGTISTQMVPKLLLLG